jgi:DNA-binding Xre family transcriptional regulator
MTKKFSHPSEYYWVGWALAQYQNYRNISFFDINKDFPVEKVLSLYNTLHEADITKFYDIADEFINNNKKETNLKKIRRAAGLSQTELAVKSGVSIRNIQMYEQRNNDINKAQVDILLKLSKTLGCNIEDLLEY